MRRAIVLLLGAVVLTACPRAEPSPAVSPVASPARGGVLRVHLPEDVDSLDPHGATSPASWFYARALHRGLLAFPNLPGPSGAAPAPDLIEAMPEISPDGLRYTFRLRDGVRFGAPAGREVRAADVVASLTRLRATGLGIARALGAVVSVEALDERTVAIVLRRPNAELPWVLAHPAAAILPADTPPRGRIAAERIAGAGPYRIAAYEPESSIRLVRNAAWSDDDIRGAFVDEITTSMGGAPGDADIIDPGPPDAASPVVAGARDVRIASGCVRYLFVDVRAGPFLRREVRRAVAHAIKRDDRGGVLPAHHFLPPTVVGHERTQVLREDLARAKQLLSASGLAKGFATTLVIGNSSRERAEAASIRRSLARAGIRVRVQQVPADDVYTGWYENPARAVPMGIATWCADWPGLAGANVLNAVTSLRPQSSATRRSVAALIAGASAAPSERAQAEWARADRAVTSLAVAIPLGWPSARLLVSGRLRGLDGAPMFPLGDPAGVWLAP